MYRFKSNFFPSDFIREEILRRGRIIKENETPQEMIDRIVYTLYSIEKLFSQRNNAINFADSIGGLMDEGKVVFSTPVMTNAGRSGINRPLSACTIPPVSLRGDLSKVKEIVENYHKETMGTGFNFDEVDDPVSTLLFLNDLAVKGASSGEEDRPVGNMGICSIDHPRIIDFIISKQARRDILWKFNISINITDSFWFALDRDALWELRNGDKIYARELFQLIVYSAHSCADPGLVFMDRINKDNPVPVSGSYGGVAPCAEVGLVPGETCQFGYINIGEFCHNKEVDLDGIKLATELMVRSLDNCLEINIKNSSMPVSAKIIMQRRKVGIGVCGLADALIRLGMPYASKKSCLFIRDLVGFINYHSKVASHKLAKERGSFGAMSALFGCKYKENPDFLTVKYGKLNTEWVSSKDWRNLGTLIRNTKLLRNSSTIALPPTGRSALVINASTGVEPIFSLVGIDGKIISVAKEVLRPYLDEKKEKNILEKGYLDESYTLELRNLLRTSAEISPEEHLSVVSALQPVVDESISKTINLSSETTVDEVEKIYKKAYFLKLKGITIYRDGTSKFQPRRLKT